MADKSQFRGEIRRTVVVHGRHAMRTERLRAARAGETGTQVMAVEHLAERLAGGFLRMSDLKTLKEALRRVIPKTNLGELEPIKHLPGMISAAASTLMKLWLSGFDTEAVAHEPRIQSVLALEKAVMEELPAHMRRPGDIISLAMSRAEHSKKIFGKVILKGMTELHPVWRPLLLEMASHVDIVWDAGPRETSEWFSRLLRVHRSASCKPELFPVSCATARHEVIEAVRWVRSLMASGVRPEDIAIATVSTHAYDDHMTAVCNDARLGIHFVHGVSAVHRPEGQAAAALADILLRGLSQKRVRRLVDLIGPGNGVFERLPEDWASEINADAALKQLGRWNSMLSSKPSLAPIKEVLMPVLQMLDKGLEGGTEAALQTGQEILSVQSLAVWERALLDGPPAALDRTIQSQRVDDGEDAHSSPCYMSAEALAASPRPYVRLLGLTSRNWPRRLVEDALIPDHVIPAGELDPLPLAEIDRRDFETILKTAGKAVVLSWPRRDAEGRILGVSALVREDLRKNPVQLLRSRTPEHAMSEADRLFARGSEYADMASAKAAQSCWNNWNSNSVTPHDGLIPAGHPRIEAVFNQFHSATSISLLLRDPLGFVWRYALGFRAPEYEDDPLAADPVEFGNIVHEILRETVEHLARKGGLAAHDDETISRTVDQAAGNVGGRTEMTKPIPPTLVWHGMMNRATVFAKDVLLNSLPPLPGQVSYAEVPFGGNPGWVREDYPWDAHKEVIVPGTGIKLQGFIDRLDLSGDGLLARVTDYKTGKIPKDILETTLGGGRELQRAIYGFAVRTLLGEKTEIEAGLLYVSARLHAPLEGFDEAMHTLAERVAIAKAGVDAGRTVPGIGARETWNDLKFALPSNPVAGYLLRKNAAFLEKLGPATEIWDIA